MGAWFYDARRNTLLQRIIGGIRMLKVPAGIYYMPAFLQRELINFSCIEFMTKSDNDFTYIIYKYNDKYRLAFLYKDMPTCHEDYNSLQKLFLRNPELYRNCKITNKI